MGYFGSKATSGLCQALIALMPPHSVYIESHLGGGALMKRKPTGVRSIGIDRDAQALEAFACDHPGRVGAGGRRYKALPAGERLAVLAAMMAVDAEDP